MVHSKVFDAFVFTCPTVYYLIFTILVFTGPMAYSSVISALVFTYGISSLVSISVFTSRAMYRMRC